MIMDYIILNNKRMKIKYVEYLEDGVYKIIVWDEE